MTSVPTLPEQRANKRFAVRKPLRYRAANSPLRTTWKHGRTLDMSAGGIRIQIPEALPAGTKLELTMEWNGLYHGQETMRLYLVASVTRTDRRGTALRIVSHRFRDASVAPPGAVRKLAVA